MAKTRFPSVVSVGADKPVSGVTLGIVAGEPCILFATPVQSNSPELRS